MKIVNLPLRRIVIPKENRLPESEDLDELVASIRERIAHARPGIENPIKVVRSCSTHEKAARNGNSNGGLNGNKYLLVHGRHRVAAARRLRLAQVPALVLDENPSDKRRLVEIPLVENEILQTLDDITRAENYQKLIDLGASVKEIAELVQKSEQFVYQRLELNGLIEEIRTGVRDKRLDFASARALVALAPEQQRRAWRTIQKTASSDSSGRAKVKSRQVLQIAKACRLSDAVSGRSSNHGSEAVDSKEAQAAMAPFLLGIRAIDGVEKNNGEESKGKTHDHLAKLEHAAANLIEQARREDESQGESIYRKMARVILREVSHLAPVLGTVEGRMALKAAECEGAHNESRQEGQEGDGHGQRVQ
jgi:ParB-like chromosome segregation protein Spo0J